MNTSVSNLSKFFDAIENGSISVKYLPVIELVDGVAHIHGIYCQIHWPHYETINMDSMFRLIEKNGLSTIVDQYFTDIALEEVATSKTLNSRHDHVFVSAYMDSFKTSKYLDHIVQRANELKFDLNRLVISIQEHYPNEQTTQQIKLIQHAAKHGIKFCGVLGKQNSTRTELVVSREFSFLKIDTALVQEVGTNSGTEKYLHNYYDTAHNLNKTVIACGIDNEHTFIAMKANGYTKFTGSFFSDALTKRELERLVQYWCNRPIHLSSRAQQSAKLGVLHFPSSDDLHSNSHVIAWPKAR